MSLFVVRHQHAADHCPAEDPQGAAALLAHLEPGNAAGFGVTLHGHAVIDGQHTLYFIADAATRADLERFTTPFAQAGTVEVLPASPCEAVVARGGCAVAA